MPTRDVLAILAQFRKGAWTNDPEDPNYAAHHDGLPLAGEEDLLATFSGTARRQGGVRGVSQMVNVRVGSENVYVDTPKVEAVGTWGRLADRLLSQQRLDEPQVIPRSALDVIPTRDNPRANFSIGDLEVSTRDSYIGRPADLSAGGQVKNLLGMFRR